MKEGGLVVVTAFPVVHASNQRPACGDSDYKVIKELRTLVKEIGVIFLPCLKLLGVHKGHVCSYTS